MASREVPPIGARSKSGQAKFVVRKQGGGAFARSRDTQEQAEQLAAEMNARAEKSVSKTRYVVEQE